MSDMEDDFMCDDEEDYDLVFINKIILLAWILLTFVRWALTEVPTVHAS